MKQWGTLFFPSQLLSCNSAPFFGWMHHSVNRIWACILASRYGLKDALTWIKYLPFSKFKYSHPGQLLSACNTNSPTIVTYLDTKVHFMQLHMVYYDDDPPPRHVSSMRIEPCTRRLPYGTPVTNNNRLQKCFTALAKAFESLESFGSLVMLVVSCASTRYKSSL